MKSENFFFLRLCLRLNFVSDYIPQLYFVCNHLIVCELILASNGNIEFLEPTEEEVDQKQNEWQEKDEYITDIQQKQLQGSID